MEAIRLSAEKRENIGKGAARKIRMNGLIPGVLYGPETKSCPLSVNRKELAALLRVYSGSSRLIDLKVGRERKNRKVIIRALQRDPITGDLEHVDLYQMSMKKKLHMTVHVRLTGTPEGVKLGGIMQQVIRELDIACLPEDIPDHVEAEVSSLQIGDSIHVRDLSVDKVDILIGPERTVVTVVPPTIIKVEEPAAAEVVEGEEVAEGEEAVEAEAGPEEGAKTEEKPKKEDTARGRK